MKSSHMHMSTLHHFMSFQYYEEDDEYYEDEYYEDEYYEEGEVEEEEDDEDVDPPRGRRNRNKSSSSSKRGKDKKRTRKTEDTGDRRVSSLHGEQSTKGLALC